jgi:hypothetical protein
MRNPLGYTAQAEVRAGRPKQTGRECTPRPSPRLLSLIFDRRASPRYSFAKREGGGKMKWRGALFRLWIVASVSLVALVALVGIVGALVIFVL